MNRLKPKQVCPIHHSKICCGRAEVRFQRVPKNPSKNGVTTFPDGREKCSPAELVRRKNRMLQAHPVCVACGESFTDYSEVELAHFKSKGNGGFKRDDSWTNLYLMHKSGNRDQGSRSLEQYLSDCAEKGVKPCQQS